MNQELTMKQLGDVDEQLAKSAKSNKKSQAKFDRDWTTKVEMKINKLSSTVKALTNKLGDLNNANYVGN